MNNNPQKCKSTKKKNQKVRKIGGLFLNGEVFAVENPKKFDIAVACDGGYQKAKKVGQKIDVLVGDMDSISEIPKDVEIYQFPVEKDFTDGEAGLEYLIEQGCVEIHIYFGLGGRLSHTIGNLQMVAKYCENCDITLYGMGERVLLKSKSFILQEKIGTTISLAPFCGDMRILTSKGLKYPLENLLLSKDCARGISNVATEEVQQINFQEGILLVAILEEKYEDNMHKNAKISKQDL